MPPETMTFDRAMQTGLERVAKVPDPGLSPLKAILGVHRRLLGMARTSDGLAHAGYLRAAGRGIRTASSGVGVCPSAFKRRDCPSGPTRSSGSLSPHISSSASWRTIRPVTSWAARKPDEPKGRGTLASKM